MHKSKWFHNSSDLCRALLSGPSAFHVGPGCPQAAGLGQTHRMEVMGWKGCHRIQFRTGTESTLAWTLTGTWALLSQKRVPVKKLPQDRPLNPPVPPPLRAPAPGLAPGPICTTLNLPHLRTWPGPPSLRRSLLSNLLCSIPPTPWHQHWASLFSLLLYPTFSSTLPLWISLLIGIAPSSPHGVPGLSM